MVIVIISGFVMLCTFIAISFLLSLWIYNPIDEVINQTKDIKTGKTVEKNKSYNTELSIVTQSISAMIQQLNQFQVKDERSDIIHYLNSSCKEGAIPACFQEWYGENSTIISQVICLS